MMTRVVCLASNVNTDLLRSQLDQLHSEAETTRRKGPLVISLLKISSVLS